MTLLLSTEAVVLSRPARRDEVEFRFILDNLILEPGTRIGIVGPSGSGKSTLLNFIGLLTWPTKLAHLCVLPGDAVDPIDLTEALMRRQVDRVTDLRARAIGYVMQHGSLLPFLSVASNALLAARLAARPANEAREQLYLYAEQLGVSGLLARLPQHISGGERQRAAVLRAMLSGARILIADEPTASLDRKTGADAMRSIEGAATAQGAAVVCASHDIAMLREHGYEIRSVVVEDRRDSGRPLREARLLEERSNP